MHREWKGFKGGGTLWGSTLCGGRRASDKSS